MKSKSIRRTALVLSALVITSLSCSLISGAQQAIQTAAPTEVSAPTLGPETPTEEPAPGETATAEAEITPAVVPTFTAAEVYPVAFAAYNEPQVSIPDQFVGGYTLPVNLSSVQGLADLGLTEAQQTLLSQNGFVVVTPVTGKYQEFYQIYESTRYGDTQPVFATTDAVYHVYHLIFDKMLRDLERDSFIPIIDQLTTALLQTTTDQYNSLAGTALEEPALRNVAYFGVADHLLGLTDPIPAAAQSLVDAEVALIEAHAGADYSPIWDRADLPEDMRLIEDYSQYIPRGHYTRSEDLKKYFKGMMWYGRMTFRLTDDFETQRALLAMQAIRTTTNAETWWANIYDPTSFIVGKSDDLSYHEYAAISDTVFGAEPALTDFADPAKFAEFKVAAENLPAPQINSMWVWIWQDRDQVTKGFRVMGQRFTLDEYVFGQVMWRKVGTIDNTRDLPKALDLFSAMGSTEASSILDGMGETAYENYTTQMDKVKGQVASLETDSWTQNVYWSWLYSFFPLIEPKDQSYPAFMQTEAWTRKSLNTALGSYTELKHDTILYAKQVMAEMGGGGPAEPPHAYVEPDPEAYARLYALAEMTEDGLQARSLLAANTQNNLEQLMDLLSFMQSVSERELTGGAISNDEYWRIQYFGGELEALTLQAADTTDPMDRDLSDQKAALVADIATGMDRVLEEGVGDPTPIYVVLPDDPTKVAIGAVYTYYEFTVTPDKRMTDETWQGMVAGGTAAPLPDWTSSFIAP